MPCKTITTPILDSRTIIGIGVEDRYGVAAREMFELPVYESFLNHQPAGERGSSRVGYSFGKRNVSLAHSATFLAKTLLSKPSRESIVPWAMLLEACGMERREDPNTGFTSFRPIEPGRSLTIHSHYGQLRHPMLGGRGTLSFSASPGREIMLDLEIAGLYIERDQEPKHMEYIETVTPIMFVDAGIEILIEGENEPFTPVVKQWTLDLGNRIFRRSSGDEDNMVNSCIIEPRREPRWSLVIEEDPRIDWNRLDVLNSKFRLSSSRTFSDGSSIYFNTNFECGLDSAPSYGTVNSVKVRNLDFNLNGDRYLEIGYSLGG